MLPAISCPDARQWQQLLCGQLPDDEAELLEHHLSECPHCLQTVRGVDPKGDTFVGMIPSRPPEPELPEDLRLLIGRLKDLRPDGDTKPSLTGLDAWPTPLVDSAKGDNFDFLAPAQQTGEMGRLGPYRVLRTLGSGGMGMVVEAEDPDLQRPVALKVMRPGLAVSDSARKRFLREARAAAALDHDHIVKIYQVGEDRGVPFIAMQLLRGQSLQDRLEEPTPLPLGEAIRIGRELAEGLAAAHAAGLIHRDIKPANIWLEEPRGRVKILDFGLARSQADDAHLTQAGALAGTPGFMAPEQARGQAVDVRSDLFSLGCVLYRLLTGAAPFQGDSAMDVLVSLANHQPPPPQTRNPEVPPALSDLVMRLLSKDPAGRPPSAGAVIETLDRLDPAATLRLAPPAPGRRRPGRWVAAAIAAGLLFAGGGLLAGIIIRIYDKEGKKIAEVQVPEGGTYKIEGAETPTPATDKRPLETKKETPLPVSDGFLARLDPEKIPAEDRFAWQPKELVAVLGEHRQRHFGSVQRVAFSADGKLIASGGDDGYLCLWDAATMRRLVLLPIPLPPWGSERMALSPTRPRLVSAAPGYGTLQLLDVADPAKPKEVGQPLAPPAGTAFAAPAFSPDGARLAVPASDGTIHLWDVTDAPKNLPPLRGHNGPVQRVAFPPGGEKNPRILFSCGNDKTIRRWDLSADTVVGQVVLEDVMAPLSALAISPDARTLVLGTASVWHVWDLSAAKPKETPFAQKGGYPVTAATFSRDGRWLVTGYPSGGDLWDLSAKPAARLTTLPLRSYVRAVAISPDGKTLVTGGVDGTVRQWSLGDDAPKERFPLRGHTNAVTDVAFTPGDRTLYSASMDGTVRSWDLGTAPSKEQSVFAPKPAPQVSLLAVSGKSPRLAGVFPASPAPRFWDLDGPEPRELAMILGGARLTLSADGTTGAYYQLNPGNEKVVVLNLRGEKVVKQELANGSPVSALALSPDGRFLACGGEDRDKTKPNLVRVWDLAAKPKPQPSLPLVFARGLIYSLTFSADSRQLVASGSEPGVQFWALAPDGKTPPKESLVVRIGAKWRSLTFSPDGKMLAATDHTGRVAILDGTANWGERLPPWQFPAPVSRVAFAGDGRHLAVGTANGTVYILRLPAQKP
jgi:WD40 repeat protein